MEDFIAECIGHYFELPKSTKSLGEELRAAGGTILESHSPAGSYVKLPRCETLQVGNVGQRILSGLWAKANSNAVVDVLLYVEDGWLTQVELAAPSNDMPTSILTFSFEAGPDRKFERAAQA